MKGSSLRSWIGQILLFLILALLFSALPFLIGILTDKSSLGIAVFNAWYAIVPPLVFLLISWLLYRGERSWSRFVARLWINVGIWFAVQVLFVALSDLHLVLLLFTLPSMLSGGEGYMLGAVIFVLGGIILWFLPPRVSTYRNQTTFALATAALLVIIFIGVPLFVGLTSYPLKTIPSRFGGLPDEGEVFGYVSDVYNMGIRRPGWEATEQAKDYIAEHLTAFGFEEVHIEPFGFNFWRERAWGLTINPQGDAWEPETYFVPYSGPTRAEGVTAEVVYLGEVSEEAFTTGDVDGKVVLVDLPPMNISWEQMKLFTYMAYDPDNTVGDWEHPYPIGWLADVHLAHDLALEHGAVGFIGVLQGYPEMGDFSYYAPYDGTLRSIPGLYLLDKDGDRLREMVQNGRVDATLVLDAQVSTNGRAWTVYGVLPGQDEEIIMVHTHYDAPWRSGIEDSSGVGMVMGLARYFAQLPASARDHKMIFIFTGSHMVGAPSNHAFMEEHEEDIMANLLLDICIEHIADDYNPPEPPTGMVEPRGNFMKENPVIVSQYAGVVADHGAYRTLVFPTGSPLSVPTDAGMFAVSGYPVSSLISGPVWLFDDDDTLERVATWEFASLSAMYVDYIQRLGRMAAPLLRFNLNVWTITITAVLLTPLATLSSVKWPRKDEE
jgi:hypothetical protein